MVSSLTNGTPYTFTVTATNSVGTSNPSSASDAVTPRAASDGGVAPLSWGLDRIDQRALPLNNRYTRTQSGAGVTVYVIDTGVRATHGELNGRVAAGFTTISDGQGTNDCQGHGTHVAGTVAGTNYGVAPSALIVPVRVMNCSGSGSTSDIIAGIDWIITHHQAGVPAVANMSLGGPRSAALDLAVARGVADGVTFVVAAGNSNLSACTVSPAGEPSAITVGSTTSTDERSSFSNFGSCLDVFAPGSSIVSAGHTSDTATRTLSGTSMAAPHVAGVAALALSQNTAMTPAEVASAIASSATRNAVTNPGTGSLNRLVFSPLTPAPNADDDTSTWSSSCHHRRLLRCRPQQRAHHVALCRQWVSDQQSVPPHRSCHLPFARLLPQFAQSDARCVSRRKPRRVRWCTSIAMASSCAQSHQKKQRHSQFRRTGRVPRMFRLSS
ncbi:MAG: hypothetical protein EBZ46_03640 [Actinobacteria bacterium]|nr:hypothetical protein [Actinomycetota bacterium]